jgi:fosfomycin resistance protein FosX
MNTKTISGISHITFICQDLIKTTHFLKELLGAQEVYSSGNKTFSLSKEKFFNVAGIWIAIMEGNSIERSYNHVAFKVSDADISWFETKIKELGLTLLPGRKRDAAEGQSLYFYDYDNHLFELHTGDLDTRLAYYNQD